MTDPLLVLSSQGTFLFAAGTLLAALIAVAIALVNTWRHGLTNQLLRATQEQIQVNTEKTEQTVIQLQNTNRAVGKAEASIQDQTQQLETLVAHLQQHNETLTLKLVQAQAALQEIESLHVALRTEERQAVFDRELAELKALLVAQALRPPLAEGTP